jgi:thiol:disulfide interchange protein DsbD
VSQRLTEWGYALSQTLQGQLEAGSFAAVAVVFAAGVLTSFTPCVYPMIPVTVTYIGGAARGSRPRAVRLSLVYVTGLALVYSALGVATALLGQTFGQFTRNPWVYGGVGLLIVAFGLMMLDIVSIPVLGFAAGMQHEGARRGGYLGALLMGMASGFVAAPCTAPVLGVLLVFVARSGRAGADFGARALHAAWGGTLLLVFALGLGLLLVLLGIFSGMLSSLPRAGAWMKRIKVAFGVGMLIVGGWFGFEAIRMLAGRA